MKQKSLLAGLILALGANVAHADNGWSGFYVGIDAGVAKATAEGYSLLVFTGGSAQDSGFTAGVSAGFDQQFGDVVLGGVADISYVGTEDMVFMGKAEVANYDLNAVATARVRAGFAVNDDLLIYGTGGLSISFVDGILGAKEGPGDGESEISYVPMKLPSTMAGYVIGLGTEYKIAKNWSLKAEFLHHKFSDYASSSGLADDPESDTPFYDNKLKTSLNTFKVGINYRF